MSEGKNFSVGDVVVCVDAGPLRWAIKKTVSGPSKLRRLALYTVAHPLTDVVGNPIVSLSEVPPPDHGRGYASRRFRLAYTPDPEVEREATNQPVRHKEPAQ